MHGAIYHQTGLLTSAGKEIINKNEILTLLNALLLPDKVSIIHYPGQQKGTSEATKENNMADQEAKVAARGNSVPVVLTVELSREE